MQRRVSSRELKLDAVKQVRDRGVAVSQASRGFDVAESVLRRWIRDLASDPAQFSVAVARRGQSSRRWTVCAACSKLRVEASHSKRSSGVPRQGCELQFAFVQASFSLAIGLAAFLAGRLSVGLSHLADRPPGPLVVAEKRMAPQVGQASWPATAPVAPSPFGTACWPQAPAADCRRSGGSGGEPPLPRSGPRRRVRRHPALLQPEAATPQLRPSLLNGVRSNFERG
jgi:transposase-like protein